MKRSYADEKLELAQAVIRRAIEVEKVRFLGSSERVYLAVPACPHFPRASPSMQTQILDSIFWIRSFLAFVAGAIWGFYRIEGFLGIILYTFASAFGLQLYCRYALHVNEKVMSKWDLLFDGFLPSMGVFAVSLGRLFPMLNIVRARRLPLSPRPGLSVPPLLPTDRVDRCLVLFGGA